MTQPMRLPIAAWVIAVLLVIGGGFWASRPAAQQRAAGPAPLETIQIRPNVFVIFGAGGNVTAHVGEDGIILVDSGSAAMGAQVVAAVRAISDRPLRLIINTS